MKKVAKLLITNPENKYLLLRRGNHPVFGADPDLPGGTLEAGEAPIETMVREVQEEAGIAIDASTVSEAYSGTSYSQHSTHYSLYMTKLKKRPEVTLSWEHTSYEWLDYSDFLAVVWTSKDTYMHMVADVITRIK